MQAGIKAADRVGPTGHVYAIEPVPTNVRSLCAGIHGNGFGNVSLMPVAASDRASVVAVLRHADSSNGIVDFNAGVSGDLDFVPTQRLDFLLHGIPRLDVVALPESATVGEALEVFREHEYSRMPVYREDLDHIVGVVFIKALLPSVERGELDLSIAQFIRPAQFVPLAV